jgi:hypothetical protein
MVYTILLRYEFIDPHRRTMKDLLWHPLSGYSVSTVNGWLKTGVFPDGSSTTAVVAGLSKGELGTKDRNIIEREICPESGVVCRDRG